jgi:hypothetical protein
MCSQVPGGRVCAARSHRGLAVGGMAVDGRRWPSVGVRRGMTGGVASSVREKSEGEFAGRAWPCWAE